MKNTIVLTCILAGLTACTSRPPKANGPSVGPATDKQGRAVERSGTSMESKILASEEQSNLVTEISFSRGKAVVTPEAKRELQELFKKAKSKGATEEIKVVTWGDAEYPSKNDEELSRQQQELVDKRNDALKAYLESLDKEADVNVYSMALRPGMFNNLLTSEDAQIKKSLEASGIPTTDSKNKTATKASKAIVIFGRGE